MPSRADSLALLRADASEEIGSGHVMRLVALAQGLRRAGGDAIFVVGGGPGAGEAARQAGFSVVPAGFALGTPDDASELLELAQEHGARALVVDGYAAGSDYLAELAALRRTVALDDCASQHLPVHVVLNPNYGAEALSYSAKPETQVLAGSDYALLRSEFLSIPREPRGDGRAPAKLVLTFGGSDPVNAGARVIRALAGLPTPAQIRLIAGPNFTGYAELSRAIAGAGLGVEVIRSPENMAECLAWGELAITAAGGTLWELAYLGLAVAAFSIVDNQDEAARSLADRNMIFGGQRLGDLSDAELRFVLEKFLVDADTRSAYARRYHTLIDGCGADRAAKAVLAQ